MSTENCDKGAVCQKKGSIQRSMQEDIQGGMQREKHRDIQRNRVGRCVCPPSYEAAGRRCVKRGGGWGDEVDGVERSVGWGGG